MTTDPVRDRVIAGFLLVFPDLGPDDVTGLSVATELWDSLASITLLATFEEEFELTFSDDDVAAMTSFDAVVATVSAALARG